MRTISRAKPIPPKEREESSDVDSDIVTVAPYENSETKTEFSQVIGNWLLFCLFLTDKANNCGDDDISGIQLMCHAVPCVHDLHDVQAAVVEAGFSALTRPVGSPMQRLKKPGEVEDSPVRSVYVCHAL